MTVETNQEQTTQSADAANQLTITDLVAMKSIIDTASQRGAFKPSEMVVVGQTYNKLVAFLEGVKQQGETK
jgi:hypothetical protein